MSILPAPRHPRQNQDPPRPKPKNRRPTPRTLCPLHPIRPPKPPRSPPKRGHVQEQAQTRPESRVNGPEVSITYQTKRITMHLTNPLIPLHRGKMLFNYADSEMTTLGGYDLVHFEDLSYVASAHQERKTTKTQFKNSTVNLTILLSPPQSSKQEPPAS